MIKISFKIIKNNSNIYFNLHFDYFHSLKQISTSKRSAPILTVYFSLLERKNKIDFFTQFYCKNTQFKSMCFSHSEKMIYLTNLRKKRQKRFYHIKCFKSFIYKKK